MQVSVVREIRLLRLRRRGLETGSLVSTAPALDPTGVQDGEQSWPAAAREGLKKIDFSIRENYPLDMLTDADLEQALTILGELLADRGESYDIVVIGGGALLLLGLIERPTKDLDVVARIDGHRWLRAAPFPRALNQAVLDVAAALDLTDDWLNPGPADLMDFGLPTGFEARAIVRSFGALSVRFASKQDQVAFKLYAAADHWPSPSRHLEDLRRLTPSQDALLKAARWCRTHDPSEGFRDHLLLPVLAALGVEASDV